MQPSPEQTIHPKTPQPVHQFLDLVRMEQHFSELRVHRWAIRSSPLDEWIKFLLKPLRKIQFLGETRACSSEQRQLLDVCLVVAAHIASGNSPTHREPRKRDVLEG